MVLYAARPKSDYRRSAAILTDPAAVAASTLAVLTPAPLRSAGPFVPRSEAYVLPFSAIQRVLVYRIIGQIPRLVVSWPSGIAILRAEFDLRTKLVQAFHTEREVIRVCMEAQSAKDANAQ
jgi:hypothetical protein